MDSKETVAAIRKILATSAPTVTVSNPKDLLAYAGELTPEFKVQLIDAMGFQSHRPKHSIDCASIQGSGLICTCSWPQTRWLAPADVVAFMHETPEERRADTDKRIAQWDKDPEDEENEFDPTLDA